MLDMNVASAVSAQAGADRLPAELALLAVLAVAVLAAAVVPLRRARGRSQRRNQGRSKRRNQGTGPRQQRLAARPDRGPDSPRELGLDRGPDPDRTLAVDGELDFDRWPDADRELGSEPTNTADVVDSSGSLIRPARAGGQDRSRPHSQPAMLIGAAVAVVVVGGLIAAVLVAGYRHSAAGHGSAVAAGNHGPGQPAYPVSPGSSGSPSPGKSHGRGPRGRGSHPSVSPVSTRSAAARGSGSGGGTSGSGGSTSGSGGGTSGTGGGTSGSGGGATAPAPAPGTLTGLPASTQNCVSVTGGPPYQCSFTMEATGGPVTYSVTEPSSELASWTVSLQNGSGTLAAGQQATVTVTVSGPGNSSDLVDLTVDPGGETVELHPIATRPVIH